MNNGKYFKEKNACNCGDCGKFVKKEQQLKEGDNKSHPLCDDCLSNYESDDGSWRY